MKSAMRAATALAVLMQLTNDHLAAAFIAAASQELTKALERSSVGKNVHFR